MSEGVSTIVIWFTVEPLRLLVNTPEELYPTRQAKDFGTKYKCSIICYNNGVTSILFS